MHMTISTLLQKPRPQSKQQRLSHFWLTIFSPTFNPKSQITTSIWGSSEQSRRWDKRNWGAVFSVLATATDLKILGTENGLNVFDQTVVEALCAFEWSQYPPKSTFSTYLPGMRPLVGAAFQSSKVWCAAFFRLPWENLNFSITIKVILKSFVDITANTHPPHTSLIHIYLSDNVFGHVSLPKLVPIYLCDSVSINFSGKFQHAVRLIFLRWNMMTCNIAWQTMK